MSKWNSIVTTSVDNIINGEEFDMDELAQEHIEDLAKLWMDEVQERYEVEAVWYPGYANGNDNGPKGIIAANWNRVGAGIGDLLERAGYTTDWCDAVCSCGDCGKAIQTQADHYGWKPEYVVGDGDIYCEDCTAKDPEFLIEDLRGNPDKALTLESVNLAEYGYTRVEQTFENGFHAGQDDSPKAIAKNLRARGIEDFIFVLDSTGQFDMQFSVWVKEVDAEEAEGIEGKCDVPPNVMLANALRSIPAHTGEGIQYNKVNADGTVTTRTLTNDEFIKGVK
jgi:hypothetical protein